MDLKDTTAEHVTSILLAVFTTAEIIFVIYLTLNEILKKTGDSFVLKDQYTIYFVTLIVIGLFFKLLIIDALTKDEISTRNSCSMFLSTFVPEFFVTLGYTCIMLKSVFLCLTLRDTKQSYQESNKKRKLIANILLIIYLVLALIVMFLRFCNTCQREKIGSKIEK